MAYTNRIEIRRALRLPRPGFVARKLKAIYRGRKTDQQPDWQDKIAAVYQLTIHKPARSIAGGVRNRSWLLETSKGKKILKQYEVSLAFEQIIYEHSVLQRLKEVNFPSPRIVRTKDSRSVVSLDGRLYGMFDYIERGYQYFNYLYLPSQLNQYLTAVGRNLAYLHAMLDGFTPEGFSINGFESLTGVRYRNLTWHLNKLAWCRERFEKSAANRPHPMSAVLFRRAGWIEELMRADEEVLMTESPERGVIHGDYGVYNLIIQPGEYLVTLDFELARFDWRLIDLVFALASVTGLDRFDSEHEKMRWITAGYRSMRPEDAESFCLIPRIWTFHFLRRVIITWENYLKSGDGLALVEAERRMARVDWVVRNREALASL